MHRGLKVLSAMGAGARTDPTRIRVADLRESTNDPLSRSVMFLAFLVKSFVEAAFNCFHICCSETPFWRSVLDI